MRLAPCHPLQPSGPLGQCASLGCSAPKLISLLPPVFAGHPGWSTPPDLPLGTAFPSISSLHSVCSKWSPPGCVPKGSGTVTYSPRRSPICFPQGRFSARCQLGQQMKPNSAEAGPAPPSVSTSAPPRGRPGTSLSSRLQVLTRYCPWARLRARPAPQVHM